MRGDDGAPGRPVPWGERRRVWRTLDYYVEAARTQEDFSAVAAVGLDETAARRGHHYISLFHDLDAGRLLFACEGREARSWPSLPRTLKPTAAVRRTCDRLHRYVRQLPLGHRRDLPWVDVTFDEFHVIQLVNKAVDEVRRREAKSTPSLKRTRYLWLKDKHAWTGRQIAQFADLRQLNLQTHRAFQIKEACGRSSAPPPARRPSRCSNAGTSGPVVAARADEAGRQDPQGPLGRHPQCLRLQTHQRPR